eukprot:2343829-Pleurochrysis_carterae.AAC.1
MADTLERASPLVYSPQHAYLVANACACENVCMRVSAYESASRVHPNHTRLSRLLLNLQTIVCPLHQDFASRRRCPFQARGLWQGEQGFMVKRAGVYCYESRGPL